MSFYAKHKERFELAQEACAKRHCWSPYPDMPDKYPDAATAKQTGKLAFDQHLTRGKFDIDQPGINQWIGEEVSPYTQQALGILYPQSHLDALFQAAEVAMTTWAQTPYEVRIGVLMEVIDTLYKDHLFEVLHAVMHTAGQSYNMAYAGSGVNALDRSIEALVYAEQAMKSVTPSALWSRRFGSSNIALQKTYRIVPKGIAVCFSCASFPTWNAWPSMMASLATGNPVIVKPHPATVLPMAITVKAFRQVLKAAGFDPNLVTMAIDSTTEPIGKLLIKHPKTAIVDFTGSVKFGQWVEQNSHPAVAFTETAGCNTVVLESTDDLDAALRNLATTMCLFSAQMCTSPQNIYIPQAGVQTPTGWVSFDEVAKRLADAVQALTSDPKKASMILATIQSHQTLALLKDMTEQASQRGHVLLSPTAYAHPDFPDARTSTPLMMQVTPHEHDMYSQERFGPISFVIRCKDAHDALTHATQDAKQHGGLTAFLYSTREDFIEQAENAYAKAGAQLTINLVGAMPLNFAAAYSDYHVTGLNPAGNATLTNLAFVTGRFGVVQSRRPVTTADTTLSANA
jgi:phenylacetic acid degradation protein paaN